MGTRGKARKGVSSGNLEEEEKKKGCEEGGGV
jgi:hypothetical protein